MTGRTQGILSSSCVGMVPKMRKQDQTFFISLLLVPVPSSEVQGSTLRSPQQGSSAALQFDKLDTIYCNLYLRSKFHHDNLPLQVGKEMLGFFFHLKVPMGFSKKGTMG